MSNDRELTYLCAKIDKETDWQQLNQFVDEVVALLEARKQEVKKLENELRTEIEVRAAKMRGAGPWLSPRSQFLISQTPSRHWNVLQAAIVPS
jgi:hypothetical protein